MTEPRLSAAGSLVPPPGWLDDDRSGGRGAGAVFLVLVTVLALVLRLYRLGGMSLWVDEIFTWDLVAPRPGADFVEQIMLAYQGPLYHAAVWPLVRIAETAAMLRLPAALASTLTVPLLGVFAARFWGRDAGRLAALLACFSPFLIWYGQEARGYAFVMFFAAASGLAFMDLVRHGVSLPRALLLALLIGGGLGSNFAFIFVPLALGLTMILVARPGTIAGWGLWAVALAGGLVLTSPWVLKAAGIWEVGRVMPGADTGQALRGETTFSPLALPFSGFALFFGFSLGPSLGELHDADRMTAVMQHAPLIGAAAVVVALPLLVSLSQMARRRWVVLLWIVVPVLGVVLLATRNIKPFNVRYLAPILPWLLVLTAAGLARLAVWPRRILAGAVVGLFLVSLAGYYWVDDYAKEDIRGAVAAMDEAGGGLPVLAPTVGPVVRHYLADRVAVMGCWDEGLVTDDGRADELVARQLAGRDQAWYLRARGWDLDPDGRLPGALQRTGTLQRVYEGAGVTLDRWQRTAVAGEESP